MVASDELPALLVLGTDALSALVGVLGDRRDELQRWRAFSPGTDFPG